jgi:hypothetical protein
MTRWRAAGRSIVAWGRTAAGRRNDRNGTDSCLTESSVRPEVHAGHLRGDLAHLWLRLRLLLGRRLAGQSALIHLLGSEALVVEGDEEDERSLVSHGADSRLQARMVARVYVLVQLLNDIVLRNRSALRRIVCRQHLHQEVHVLLDLFHLPLRYGTASGGLGGRESRNRSRSRQADDSCGVGRLGDGRLPSGGSGERIAL